MRVALVFGAALALRLWGIGFGLPALYHPDEPAFVLQALAVARGLPNALTFANPPLFKYVLLVEYALTYELQHLAGVSQSPQDFVNQFRADPSLLYLMARITSAVFGALTAVATYALGSAVAGRRVGLIAAFLTAITYLLVRESHFGVNDALVTLLVTGGLIFCVRVQRGGLRRDYLAAGALAGLAFAAKYYGIALLAPLALAHVSRPARCRRSADLAMAAMACLVASVVAFPSLITEPVRVVQDIYVHLFVFATGGYDGLDPSGGYIFYAKVLAIGLGWPLTVMALAGVGVSLARRQSASLVVACLPLAMLLVLGAQRLYFARFVLPAVPALLVEASLVLDTRMARRLALGVIVGVMVGALSLLDAARFDALLTQTDTRTLAREWIDSSLPVVANIAVDAAPLGPTLSEGAGHQVLVANDFSLFDLTLADYRALGVQYVVLSSFTSEARAVDPVRDARRRAFAAELASDATPVTQFGPYTGETQPPFVYDQIYGPWNALDQLQRPGPSITVYQLAR